MARWVERPSDSQCMRPLPPDIPPGFHAPDHPDGIYVSTYCEHGLGDGRDKPSLCRLSCKLCKAPCACTCHDGATTPYPGFSAAEEDRLRVTVRNVVHRLGVAPHGPRGDELIADILTGVFAQLDRDGDVGL